MSYSFDQKHSTPHYEICVDTSAKYGYFEHNTLGDNRAGGLWFADRLGEEKLVLVDYDGVFALPIEVGEALRVMGFIVDDDFM